MGVLTIKLFMTTRTQANPIRNISKIFSRPVRPVHTMSFSFFSTMFTRAWCTPPLNNPTMKSTVTHTTTLPVWGVSKSVSLGEFLTRTIFRATKSFVSWVWIESFVTNDTINRITDFLGLAPALKTAKHTPIWSRQKGIPTIFANFVNHSFYYIT